MYIDELNAIRERLLVLLEENEKVEELKMLERDDFAIDIEKRRNILEKSSNALQKYKDDYKQSVSKLDTLKNLLLDNTKNTIETQ